MAPEKDTSALKWAESESMHLSELFYRICGKPASWQLT